MPMFLNSSDSDFTDMFEALLHTKREFDSDVDAVVATILSDVRARADVALIELTAKFDNF